MRLASLALCALILLGALSDAPAFQNKDEVKVALTDSAFPGLSHEKLRDAAEPFKSLLSKSTGLAGDFVLGGAALDVADKLKKDDLQLAVFNGVEFAWAKARNPKLEPIVIFVNQKQTVSSHLIVGKAAKYKEAADLRGATLAQPKEIRSHDKLFLDRKVVPSDSKAEKFFKTVKSVEDVETALDDVADGLAHAAVVDGLAWESYKEAKPGVAGKLRILATSGPLPSSVLVAQSGKFSADKIKQIRDGLIKARGTGDGKKLLQQLRLTGFDAVPTGYAKQLATAAKAFPPPKSK